MSIKTKIEIMRDIRSMAGKMSDVNKRAERLRGQELDGSDEDIEQSADIEKGPRFTEEREP